MKKPPKRSIVLLRDCSDGVAGQTLEVAPEIAWRLVASGVARQFDPSENVKNKDASKSQPIAKK